jgi:hypothetical protein
MNGYQKVLASSLVALVLAIAPTALAGKPGGGGGGTTSGSYGITISPGGPYTFGQNVYATTTVPESMGPFVWMRCYQNGVLVGSSDHAAFAGGWYYNWPFTLGPSASWAGGSADCTFSVVVSGKKASTLASGKIHVDA